MPSVLACWVGHTDIRASQGKIDGLGPIANVLTTRSFDEVRFLANPADQGTRGYKKEDYETFVSWLRGKTKTEIAIDYYKLSSPTDFEEIFPVCRKSLQSIQKAHPNDLSLTFHISPGTPHMATTWIILSESEFAATRLIESSLEQGVKDVHLPISLTAEWIPSYIRNRDSRLEHASTESAPASAQFSAIIHKSEIMKRVIYRANKVAPRNIPVLIEGESGTGKELIANAIHNTSLRSSKPFVPVNCGALPKDLIESTLFGHEKGSFTGATSLQKGKFEQANGGTLFLDELGELPLEAQVRFLRVLEDKKVWRVGATEPVDVDVRVIAATNRNLITEVAEGNFREDLFYRLAVAVLKLPPLRQRGEDVKFLMRQLLEFVNKESRDEPGHIDKSISPEGEKIMFEHPWPGNVREMLNTLRRLVVWSDDPVIGAEDVRNGLFTDLNAQRKQSDVMGLDISQGIDLKGLLENIERHYVQQAWKKTNGAKKRAAKLLGISNYQTLDKRLEKYGLK